MVILKLWTVWCVQVAWRGGHPPCPSLLTHPRLMSLCFCRGHCSVPGMSLPLSVMATALVLWVEVGDGNSQGPRSSPQPAVKFGAYNSWGPVEPRCCWRDKGPRGSSREPLSNNAGEQRSHPESTPSSACLFLSEQLLLPCICVSHAWDSSCKVLIDTQLPVRGFPRCRICGTA